MENETFDYSQYDPEFNVLIDKLISLCGQSRSQKVRRQQRAYWVNRFKHDIEGLKSKITEWEALATTRIQYTPTTQEAYVSGTLSMEDIEALSDNLIAERKQILPLIISPPESAQHIRLDLKEAMDKAVEEFMSEHHKKDFHAK